MNFTAEELDISEFSDLVVRAGLARLSERRAICLRIGLNTRSLTFIEYGSENAFAMELISHLFDIEYWAATDKLCKELVAFGFRGELHQKLLKINMFIQEILSKENKIAEPSTSLVLPTLSILPQIEKIEESFFRAIEKELRMDMELYWPIEKPDVSQSYTLIYFSDQATKIQHIYGQLDVLYMRLRKKTNIGGLGFFDNTEKILEELGKACAEMKDVIKVGLAVHSDHKLGSEALSILNTVPDLISNTKDFLISITMPTYGKNNIVRSLSISLLPLLQALDTLRTNLEEIGQNGGYYFSLIKQS